MKLVLVFRSEDADILKPGGAECLRTLTTDFERLGGWKRKRLSSDQEVWLCPSETNPADEEWERFRKGVSSRVETIAAALHASAMADQRQIMKKKLSELFNNVDVHVDLFSKSGDVWDCFSRLMVKIADERARGQIFEELVRLLMVPSVMRNLRNLIHRLQTRLGPISLALDGLTECDFLTEEAMHVADDFRDGKARKRFFEAQDIVYGKGRGEESLGDLIMKVQDRFSPAARRIVQEHWERLKTLLPNREGYAEWNRDISQKDLNAVYGNQPRIGEIVEAIGDREKIQTLKSKFRNRNPFREWLGELDNACDCLREAIEAELR